jgi:hypothetical protein
MAVRSRETAKNDPVGQAFLNPSRKPPANPAPTPTVDTSENR